jgi:ABC-2 type transport system permease protein
MVVLVALTASSALAAVVAVPWQAVIVAPLLFVLGYLFLGSLMLATAALGANAAESQKLTMGWALLAIVPLMLLVILLEEPHGLVGQALTWIPFTSPLTVIIRLAVDAAGIAWWEVAGSIGVLLISTWLSIRIGARLFRVGFLLTGSRPSLAELWRQAR